MKAHSHFPFQATKHKVGILSIMEGLLRLVNVAICCLFLFLTTNGASIQTKLREDNKDGSIIYPESLFLVGMADGKGFFVDNDVYLNWTDAKSYCENANMQLASITSKAQADMLNSSYHAENFYLGYWTSGRDVLDLPQFVWDNDNKQPDNAYLTFWKYHEDQLTCLFYESYETNSFVRNGPCNLLLRPFCDTGNLSSNK